MLHPSDVNLSKGLQIQIPLSSQVPLLLQVVESTQYFEQFSL